MTQRQARSVHLAKDRSRAGNLGDERLFAEPHLTDPLTELGAPGKFSHPPQRSGGELAEWKKIFRGHATHRLVIETRFQQIGKKKARSLADRA